MKVVLFCGGYGMRMRCCHGEGLPKPLQPVGDLPLVVHVMSHYASFGPGGRPLPARTIMEY